MLINKHMINSSRKHLEKSQETYVSHGKFAFKAGFLLLKASLASFVHAIIPGYFPGTAAKTVIDLYHERLINHPNTDYKEYISNKRSL